MSLLEELNALKKARVRGLHSTWEGPLKYDPMEFSSPVYLMRPWKSLGSYESVWRVWTYLVSFSVLCSCNFHWWPWEVPRDNLPDLPTREAGLTLLYIPLSFLLAFRLQRTAVRFYDARASAGKMVEGCRTAASKIITAYAFSRLHSDCTVVLSRSSSPNRRSEAGLPELVPGDESPRQVSTPAHHDCCKDLRDQFLRWTMAVPVATKDYLRGCTGPPDELFGILNVEDARKMRAAQQPPLYCLHTMRILAMRICRHTDVTRDPVFASTLFAGLSESVDVLTGATGAMERINGTPLPVCYAGHMRIFLLLYLSMLPVVLVERWGWYCIVITAVIAWALLGIEAAATECERPFRCRDNHLHFEKFCCVVTDNICELLELAEDRGIPYRNRDHHEDHADSAALAFSDSFFF